MLAIISKIMYFIKKIKQVSRKSEKCNATRDIFTTESKMAECPTLCDNRKIKHYSNVLQTFI